MNVLDAPPRPRRECSAVNSADHSYGEIEHLRATHRSFSTVDSVDRLYEEIERIRSTRVAGQ